MDIFKLIPQLDPTQDSYLPKSVELSNIRQIPSTKYASLLTLLFAASLVCFAATSAQMSFAFIISAIKVLIIFTFKTHIWCGDTYARFRLTTDTAIDDTTPGGAAVDGEVEDYQIAIAPAPLCPAAKADLWFANDESGSVDATEFDNALDFLYQVSDSFVYDDDTGMKAGITGWTELPNSMEIVMPITESFGDSEDFGLLSTNNITLNNNTKGVRELYASKQNSSPGTRLDYATNYLADLITAGNGKRTGVSQVAIMLTDADSSFINDLR